jgi:hypothetical protein
MWQLFLGMLKNALSPLPTRAVKENHSLPVQQLYCTSSHYSFIGFNILDVEPSFQRENWIVPLKTFLSLYKPSVKSLLCVTASHTKALYVEEDFFKLPFLGIDNLLNYH